MSSYPTMAYNYGYYYPVTYPAMVQPAPANTVPMGAEKLQETPETYVYGDMPVPQSAKVLLPDIERAASKGVVTRKGMFGEKGFATIDHWGWVHLNIPHWFNKPTVLTIARVDTQGNIYMRRSKDGKEAKLEHVGKVDDAGQAFIPTDMLRDPAGSATRYQVSDEGTFGKFKIEGAFTVAQRNAIAFIMTKDADLKRQHFAHTVGKTVCDQAGDIVKGIGAQVPALVIGTLLGRVMPHKA